nr:DNA polymerase Y family protein [Aquamicrobium lusatiense]
MRRRLGRSWRSAGKVHPPLVLSLQRHNTVQVAALDARAEALGLKRGMGLADARAMHPALDVVEADPAGERRLLEALADWCDRYTPLVALDGENGLFLDVTGCTSLFGGEKPMLEMVLAQFFDQGFDVRAGLASTSGAAWAAARFQGRLVVAPGGEADLLARLPPQALRLDAQLCTGLDSVGLRSIGEIMAAPRAPLARRFGRHLMLRLDQALGRIDEAVSPRLPVPALVVERQLAEPVVLTEDIERLVQMLALSLKGDLERRGEGARQLGLSLFRVDGAVSRIAVSASLPLRDPGRIHKLFRERLAAAAGDFDAGYGFDLVRLAAFSTAPFDMRQTDLSGVADRGDEDLALFADRVRARLGRGAVMQPVAVESHVPERAVALQPFAGKLPEAGSAGVPQPALPERPVRLFGRPEPVEVPATELPEGPPMRFRWRRALHSVVRAEGPERIAPEWWRNGEDVPERDYYRVEDSEGRRYWLYRLGHHETGQPPPRWFMHGLFA